MLPLQKTQFFPKRGHAKSHGSLSSTSIRVCHFHDGGHSKAIKSVQCCTKLCEKKVRPPCKRLKRAFITLWVLFFNIFVLILFGVIPGVAYIFFCFPFLLVCCTLYVIRRICLHCFNLFLESFSVQVLLILFFKPRAMKPFPAFQYNKVRFKTCCFFSFL